MNRDKHSNLYTIGTLRDLDGNVTAEIATAEPTSVGQIIGMLQAERRDTLASRVS